MTDTLRLRLQRDAEIGEIYHYFLKRIYIQERWCGGWGGRWSVKSRTVRTIDRGELFRGEVGISQSTRHMNK